MKYPEKISGVGLIPISKYNELVDVVRWLMQNAIITAGPGLEVRVLPQGRGVGLSSISQDEVSGDPKVLASTQGARDTDSYDRETDGCPVQLQVLTDWDYDPSTHQLTFRTRTVTAVGITAVSAESELVICETAVECPSI